MKALKPGPAQPSTDIVLDFLYHDKERIASFLAQFEPAGYLQQITRAKSRTDTGGKEVPKALDLGNKISPVGLEFGRKKISSTQKGTSYSRVYDPLWANAVNFLNLIDEAGYLHRDFTSAGMGQIVQAVGSLELLDVRSLKDVWSMEDVKSELDRRFLENAPEQDTELEASMAMAKNFPHVIQAHIISEAGKIWSTLKPEAMTTSAEDILLKYGVYVDGTWTAVGILDAIPRDEPSRPPAPLFGRELIQNSTLCAQFYINIVPLMRGFLGRPIGFHGMTPLLICRQIGGKVT